MVKDQKEVKRRQGQKRPDGTVSTPKMLCPKCSEYLVTAYIQEHKKNKRVGLSCPSKKCDYIIKDSVELDDE